MDWKLALIEKLTQSIRKNDTSAPHTMHQAFGAWKSEESAEKLISELRNSRHTNRQIEPF
ncbi:MAG: hypothetical protein AAF399_12975 [Bacteroidota bacterium]